MDLIVVTMRGKSGQICTHMRAKIHTQKSKPKKGRGKEKGVWAGKKTGKRKKSWKKKRHTLSPTTLSPLTNLAPNLAHSHMTLSTLSFPPSNTI